jgi:hypothetical protein
MRFLPMPTSPGSSGGGLNYQWLTDNGMRIVGIMLIVVAIGVLMRAKSGKVSDALSTFLVVVVAIVIIGLGSVLTFGSTIASALFG